jgi:hypothetical protein
MSLIATLHPPQFPVNGQRPGGANRAVPSTCVRCRVLMATGFYYRRHSPVWGGLTFASVGHIALGGGRLVINDLVRARTSHSGLLRNPLPTLIRKAADAPMLWLCARPPRRGRGFRGLVVGRGRGRRSRR